MDEVPKCVATAIADTQQESRIATSLHRLGWRVVERAIDIGAIERAQTHYPTLRVVASDDFRGIERISLKDLILLRGKGERILSGSVAFPHADHELHLLLQSHESNLQTLQTFITPIRTQTHLVASIGRNFGTTTTAINFAAEYAARGENVLLVDAHLGNPSIARTFEMHAIDRTSSTTPYGFSIAEVSTRSRLDQVTSESAAFDRIIIDAGELTIDERTTVGRRFSDYLWAWVLQSSDALHLLTENSQHHLKEVKAQSVLIPTIAEINYVDLAIICKSIHSRKELDRLAQSSQHFTQIPTVTFPLDNRALSILQHDSTPLLFSAPKSTLRRAIQNHIERYSAAMKSTHR